MSGFTGRPHSTLTDYFMCCRQWRRCSRQRTMIPSAPTHTSSPSNWHYFLTSRRKVNVTTTLSLFCFFPPLYSPSPPFPLSPLHPPHLITLPSCPVAASNVCMQCRRRRRLFGTHFSRSTNGLRGQQLSSKQVRGSTICSELAPFVFLCVQRSNRDLAMLALEKLVDKSPNTQQVLTALR